MVPAAPSTVPPPPLPAPEKFSVDLAPKATIRAPMDVTHLTPKSSLNLEFVAMPDEELVAHLDRHRHTGDFVDICHVRAQARGG